MAYNFNPFTGNLDEAGAAPVAEPAGSDTQIQYNDNGTLAGDADLTWDTSGATSVLGVGGDINLDDGGANTLTLQTVTPTAARTISFPDATGTVGLVAGSTSQFVYNNAGAYAGVSTMTFDGTSVTLAGRLINSYTSLASSPAKVFTGTWFTGGTATTTKPHFLIEPSGATSTAWSTSGTGFGVNAASSFAGNLLDLQVNGTSQVAGTSSGTLFAKTSYALAAPSEICIKRIASATAFLSAAGGFDILFGPGTANSVPSCYAVITTAGQVKTGIAGSFAFASSAIDAAADLVIARDAANTLAQRNGTSAQTTRVYNTFTSATNFERAKLQWDTNVLKVGTEKGADGGTARDMELQTDGTTRITLKANGAILFAGLPTSDPAVAGQLWNDGNTLKISAG